MTENKTLRLSCYLEDADFLDVEDGYEGLWFTTINEEDGGCVLLSRDSCIALQERINKFLGNTNDVH